MSTKTILGAAILAVACFRIWYAGLVELSPDEAYYARWADRPALSYRDHPPAVALAISLTTRLAGRSERGVRLPAVIFAALTMLLSYALAREVGLPRGLSLGAPLLTVVTVLPSVGGIIITPDAPLLCAWTAGAALLVRAVRTNSLVAWIGVGVAVGFTLWAKHSSLLFVLAALAARPVRQRLFGRGPLVSALVALACALPILWAEAREGFLPLRFQLAHAYGLDPEVPGWSRALAPVGRLFALCLSQAGLLTPVLAWEAWCWLRRPSLDPTCGLLYALAVVPLAAVALAALVGQPEPNWTAPAYPALIVGALWHWSSRPRRVPVAAVGVVVAAAMTFTVHLHAARPLLPLPPTRDPVSRLHGWRSIARQIGHTPVSEASDYGTAAELWYYLPGHPDVRVGKSGPSWRRLAARRSDGALVREVLVR